AVAHEAGEEVELLLRQAELDAGAPGAARAGIDPQIAGVEDLAAPGGLAVGAAHDRAHAGEQLTEAERFGDVVVSAELQAGDAVDLILAGGEHQDRDVALLAQDAADREAVQAR